MRTMGWLTLLSGLLVSSVAIFYSVAGLTSIFSASVIPIIIMGTSLELAKLVSTAWLKQHWEIAPRFLKIYLTVAVVALMLITSMGIFGYLSKAHADQALASGDVQAKIAVYDQKIQISKDNIDADRKALKQLDDSVDQVMGRTTDSKGASKAVSLRRTQRDEHARLTTDIETEQKNISQLTDASAPIRAEIRKVDADVGPIKYIAALIYGDKIGPDVLEKAVRWVIILLVIVFDPLAVSLLLASQYSFQLADDEKKKRLAEKAIIDTAPKTIIDTHTPEPESIFPHFDIDVPMPEIDEPELIVEDEIKEDDPPVEEPELTITHTSDYINIEDRNGNLQRIPTHEVTVINDEYVKVDGQVYHHKAYDHGSKNSQEIADRLLKSTYIQNEEQTESNKWSEIAKAITEEEYLQQARNKQAPRED